MLAFSNMSVKEISVAILSKNSQKYLEKVLQALESFEEIILLDSGSSDETLSIAKQFPNVKIHHKSFTNFGNMRNEAAKLSTLPWILVIDSDEVLSPDALKQLSSFSLDPEKVYSFPFHNYYKEKWIYTCGWYPDRHTRLYPKAKARYSEKFLHENLEHKLPVFPLQGAINHYSYDSIEDFLHKMQHYSKLFALEYKGKKFPTVFTAIGHGFFAFIKAYVLKRGFIQGYEGFLIASYQSLTAFYKYLKLREANLS